MKIGKGYFHVLVALISLAYLSGLGFGQQRKITPQTIMNRMAQRYANCSSYQDVGVVETTHNEANSARIERMPFKTYFVRPQFFRFEWIDYFPWKDGRTRIVWSDGKEAFTYWEPDLYEDEVRDEILKTFQGKLGSETAISLDGHPGREVKIIVSGLLSLLETQNQ